MTTDRGDVKFTLAADDSQVVAAFNGIKTQASATAASLQGAFGSLQNGLSGVSKAFLGLGAVLVGGGIFKAATGAAAEWNGEAAAMAKQLGVTAQEASV